MSDYYQQAIGCQAIESFARRKEGSHQSTSRGSGRVAGGVGAATAPGMASGLQSGLSFPASPGRGSRGPPASTALTPPA